jgi:DNA-binding beta-propeller fold protein YncE
VKNRLAFLFLGLALFFPVAAIAQAPPPALVLKARILLPNAKGRMDHLGVDIKGERLFAADFDNHTLEVIDLKAGRLTHTISDLDNPQSAFYDPATNRIFVPCEGDGAVKIFDGTSFQFLQTVKLSSDADNIRYDVRHKHVLVGYGGEKFLFGKVVRGQGDGALAILDDSGKKLGDIAVDAHPESFQLEKSGNRAFVNVPDRHEIQVADLDKNTVIAHWQVACEDNFPMALDEAHHRLFVECRVPASLVVFNTDTGKVVASLPGASSDDIFYDANKARIYVLGQAVKGAEPRTAGPGFITVFQQKDADHYTKVGTYPSGPGAWTGFLVPEWSKLFVSARRQGEHSGEILAFETK